MLVQLHRVKFNGSGDRRLTDPALTHRADVSPDGKYFVDVEQAHDKPPVTRLRDFNGKLVAEIAVSDTSQFDRAGPEEGRAVHLHIGRREDAAATDSCSSRRTSIQSKKYPMLVSVYGGPSVDQGPAETFVNANPLAEYGFLILKLDARTTQAAGGKILDTTYMQLGVAEMDDFAAGIRSLWSRPYVDRERVGIYGHVVWRHRGGDRADAPSGCGAGGGGQFPGDGLPALRHGVFRALSSACRQTGRCGL